MSSKGGTEVHPPGLLTNEKNVMAHHGLGRMGVCRGGDC